MYEAVHDGDWEGETGSIQYWKTKKITRLIKPHYATFIKHVFVKGKHMHLLRSLSTALSNIAARANHLHYRACVQFILLGSRCSSSCLEDLWSLQMKWKTSERRREFLTEQEAVKGEHKARWLRGERSWRWKGESTSSVTYKHGTVSDLREDAK